MTQTGNGVLTKLNTFLDENLSHLALPSDAICRKVGLSRSHLYRIIKEHTDLSITLYIRQKRLEKSRELLTETDLRVSEIAYLVGIESPQNFSKYFASAFHLSPTEYRNQAQLGKTAPVSPPVPKASIAVLPFLNLSNDADQEFFSDGVTEEIINALSHVPDLQVAGRTSSFAFKGKNQDLRQIGEQLNVTHILEGSVRKAGQKLRITAQLIKVADGYHVWSEKYDRELNDIFDIQDEIALAILKEVKVQLLGVNQNAVLKRYTLNADAYLLYLHGRFYHNKFAGFDEFNRAIGYFQSAIDREPTYAIAYAGIASCYLNMWFYRHLPSAVCLPLMKQATEQAIQLDNTVPESYLALARMQLLYQWDFSSAATSFKKALELNWNTAELYGQYALYWGLMGYHAKAEEQIRLALTLEPFSLINNFYAGYGYWMAGKFEKAIDQGKRLAALEPTFWGGHLITGLNLITLQNYAEARPALETALHLHYNGITLSALGALWGLTGETEKARQVLAEMEILNTTQAVAQYDRGIVHACLGEVETACGYFQSAIDQHEPPMLFFRFIVRDWLAGSRYDAQYERLIRQLVH
ncbi:helix-turn-helix domain-containing protein [Larkinella rosea]|uniref:Helix-turn-helix domain-containing protein n=1 Tax=Larkinella rosea TaxID=2025312 RepID=A0A3P1C2H4_9BACT|nr:helix-turn-helix domain-containing protein [Larkinella rosea]RRB07610.1 helix-turn-helix domain-containing protein [Larkinella rosea]